MTDPTPEDVERVARALDPAAFHALDAGIPSGLEETVIRRSNAARHDATAALTAMPDHSALIRELRDALADYLSLYDGWNDEQLLRRVDDVTAIRIKRARAALRKANEALGEKA